jgi:hypothetical protein
MAVVIEPGVAGLQVGDGDGLHTVGHAVPLDVVDVGTADPRKADELPADLVAVASIARIREEAFPRVLPKQIEEEARRCRL